MVVYLSIRKQEQELGHLFRGLAFPTARKYQEYHINQPKKTKCRHIAQNFTKLTITFGFCVKVL